MSSLPGSADSHTPPRIDFAGSPRPTLGVEWEFALVDARTRDLSNEAAAVIAEIGETPHVHKELLRNTVEVVTGVCDTAGEAMDDLRSTLGPVRGAVFRSTPGGMACQRVELGCQGTDTRVIRPGGNIDIGVNLLVDQPSAHS